MYRVLRSKIIGWRGKTLLARSEPLLHECEPHWWLAQPLTKRPDRFRFHIDGRGPRPDNYPCGSGIDMYSRRLVELLSAQGVRHEAFPADVIDVRTGEGLGSDYMAFHLLEIHPAVDHRRSDLTYDGDGADRAVISAVRRLVLTEECLRAGRPMFRPAELFGLVLVHERLVAVMEDHGITGNVYTPLEQFRVGG